MTRSRRRGTLVEEPICELTQVNLPMRYCWRQKGSIGILRLNLRMGMAFTRLRGLNIEAALAAFCRKDYLDGVSHKRWKWQGKIFVHVT